MALLVLQQEALGALILLCDEGFHLVVDELGGLLAIGLLPLLLTVVVADVG